MRGEDLAGAIERFRRGEMGALARLITVAENRLDGYEKALGALHSLTGRAERWGITGPPGAGKSTLVQELTLLLRREGRTVGVVAVDPTSPFSGGAVLGDRIRMGRVGMDPGVFIRSMASRGSLGGLSEASEEVADLLDAFGKDVVILETVGVGQSELEVSSEADSTVVILVPESGDGIQALKAGLLEIADILVVNKADREGADALLRELGGMLELRGEREGWTVPALGTVAAEGVGVEELKGTLEHHRRHLERSGLLARRRRGRIAAKVRRLVARAVEDRTWGELRGRAMIEEHVDRILREEETPYDAAEALLRAWGIPSA